MNKRQFMAASLTAAVSAAGCTRPNEPTPMVKLVFLLHRRPGMAFDDFSRYWRDRHASTRHSQRIGCALASGFDLICCLRSQTSRINDIRPIPLGDRLLNKIGGTAGLAGFSIP